MPIHEYVGIILTLIWFGMLTLSLLSSFLSFLVNFITDGKVVNKISFNSLLDKLLSKEDDAIFTFYAISFFLFTVIFIITFIVETLSSITPLWVFLLLLVFPFILLTLRYLFRIYYHSRGSNEIN